MLGKALILLTVVIIANSAEMSSSYAMLEKQANFKPDLKTEPVAKSTRDEVLEPVRHPIFRAEEHNNRRAKIEPVRPTGPVIKHDRMLSDQPSDVSTEVNRIDNLAIPGYGYVPNPVEVAYPDIPYAPGYNYDNGYSASNSYDMYGNSPGPYYGEPDVSPFSMLWGQVPDSRTIVSYVGRTISWVFSSFFVLFLGSLITIGVCTYTDLCVIHFNGVGPIHEEMRSIITPERLEKISNAADFVKTAINKYQKIQTVADVAASRRRR
ncbi:unnamed protein product [Diatraea saccharalis]|uniref:Uncharacterized protein n=1 Tax=Diatraea saccharalis TaxID=40085 RepID=A0A9N9R0K5_9NEOP|nr:unnamed protein product [Diatraea saccharalis]